MLNVENIVSKLMMNEKVLGLVKAMKPLDIVRALADHGLSPKDASRVALGLIKRAEGLSAPSIDRNPEYPVPVKIRRDNEREEEHIARPQGKIDITPKYIIRRWTFPADPEAQPEDWPFDDHTVAGMKGKNKQKKRSITANSDARKRRHLKKGNPFDVDLTINQPGGDGAGGGGVHRRTDPANTGGSMPGSGNAGFVARGTKGFNSMPGKEFEKPATAVKKKAKKKVGEDERPPNAGDDDDEPKFLKKPNTGASLSVVNLGYGGRTPARKSKAGYRGYGRR